MRRLALLLLCSALFITNAHAQSQQDNSKNPISPDVQRMLDELAQRSSTTQQSPPQKQGPDIIEEYSRKLGLPPPTKTQAPSLFLVGVEMRLGMSQEEIMRQVPEQFIVQLISGNVEQYFIRSRQRNSNDSYDFYGVISFKDGKLTYASKGWYINRGPDYNLAEAIYFVIADVEKRGESLVRIRTNNNRSVAFTDDEVILTFSDREVTISATDYQGSKSVQVTEEIRAGLRP